jgi:hypothetical protein
MTFSTWFLCISREFIGISHIPSRISLSTSWWTRHHRADTAHTLYASIFFRQLPLALHSRFSDRVYDRAELYI